VACGRRLFSYQTVHLKDTCSRFSVEALKRLIAVTAVLLIWLLVIPSVSFSSERVERVILVVSDSPLTVKAKALSMTLQEASRVFEDRLRSEVEARLSEIREAGVEFRVVEILVYAIHGAVIEVRPSAIKALSASPGLKIYRDLSFKPYLERSSRLVRADEAHRLRTSLGVNLTGKGVSVAVIDTGVDYTHPDLGGSIGPGQKVAGGYDFIDEDEDPMDEDGHGTAVAGIIAADGRLKGIAPEASILAYRIVGVRGSVRASDLIRALERAVKDGAKVINLSLGTSEEIEAVSVAVRNVVESGVVVVAATGNEGGRAFGEPAAQKEVIAVGASLNNVTTSMDAVIVVAPDGYELAALYMNGSRQIPEGTSGELIYVKYAREEDLASINITGKIALAERGGEPGELVYFSEKEANVAAKGGRGLIVYNNQPGIYVGNLIGPHNPPSYRPSIPVVSISREDGLQLKRMLDEGRRVEVTIASRSAASSLIGPDRVAFFSSRGPVSPFYIKPDLVAPGVNINSTSINGGYAVQDGTSFSAPHVSGAAALLLQDKPNLTPAEVAGILAPTAKVMYDQWRRIVPSSFQGSGRLDVLSAVRSPLAVVPHQLVLHVSEGQPNMTRVFKIIPVEEAETRILLSTKWNRISGVDVRVDPDVLNITGEGSEEVYVTASVVDAPPGLYEGRITLSLSEYQLNLSLPLAVYVNNASLRLVSEGDVYKVSMAAKEQLIEAKVKVTAPDGERRVYPLGEDASTILHLHLEGEYWIDGEGLTPSGRVFARGIFEVSKVSLGVKIPMRFIGVLAGFLVLMAAASSAVVFLNRSRYRRMAEGRVSVWIHRGLDRRSSCV